MANDVAKALLTKSQATKLCEQIRAGVKDVSQWVYELHEGQGWKALGYDTWKECCRLEFHHSDWWGRNQARIAQVKLALPPPKPSTEPSKRVAGVAVATPAPLSDKALSALASVPEAEREAVIEAASSNGKPPTAAAIREAAKGESLGRCPNCKGEKWDKDEEGVSCSRCHHPHGEPAGDVDEDRVKTQRSKTVKTAEALMRAFDDLHDMRPNGKHDQAIAGCKTLLSIAKGWK